MPRVTIRTFARLEQALTASYDGAVLVDSEGRRQPLCAVYRTDALDRARPSDPQAAHGMSMRRLVERLRLRDVPAAPGEALDVDTWQDLHRLRETD
jgi:CTP:molybdopterin cytidylyltransferase MocA